MGSCCSYVHKRRAGCLIGSSQVVTLMRKNFFVLVCMYVYMNSMYNICIYSHKYYCNSNYCLELFKIDFFIAKQTDDTEQLLLVTKVGAAHELYKEMGINMLWQLEHLQLILLGGNSGTKCNKASYNLPNLYKHVYSSFFQ